MDAAFLKRYLEEKSILPGATISLLGSGESNLCYLAQSRDYRLVIRTPRKDIPAQANVKSEHHFLLFVEAMGVSFAPRSIHYDEANDIHITSYIEGTDASVVNLDETQSITFIEQLKQLGSIAYHDYTEWCEKAGYTPYKPLTTKERSKVNIEDRLEYIRSQSDGAFARQVVQWAEPKIAKLHEAYGAAPHKTMFYHDDLRWNEGGGNIKIAGNRLYFLDWELTCFMEEGVPEIGDVIGSIPIREQARTIGKRLYELYIAGENDVQGLNRAITYGALWGKLGNPLWAAERYLRMRAAGQSGIERYHSLAAMSMEDAEFYFGHGIGEWF